MVRNNLKVFDNKFPFQFKLIYFNMSTQYSENLWFKLVLCMNIFLQLSNSFNLVSSRCQFSYKGKPYRSFKVI